LLDLLLIGFVGVAEEAGSYLREDDDEDWVEDQECLMEEVVVKVPSIHWHVHHLQVDIRHVEMVAQEHLSRCSHQL
jgi:hypothetical protein